MSNVHTHNFRDWDAKLERAKERAHGLVQPERISRPDLRITLPANPRTRRISAHLWAPVLALAIGVLSYWSVSKLLGAPTAERVVAAAPARPAALSVPPPPLAAEEPAVAAQDSAVAADEPEAFAEPSAPEPQPVGEVRRRGAKQARAMRRALRRLHAESAAASLDSSASAEDDGAPIAIETTAQHAPLTAAGAASSLPSSSPPAAANELKAEGSLRELAQAEVDALEVNGSLATSSVRRALQRLRPQFTQCYRQANASARAATVRVEALIDEMGRIREPRTQGADAPGFAGCITAATRKLVAEAPDTGTVSVAWQLHLSQ